MLSRGLSLCVVVVAATCGAASSRPRHRRDSTPDYFELPANATMVVGPITTGFDCTNLPYGYYADPANDCKIFHLCNPEMDASGNLLHVRMFSFFCGEETIFDQSTLTCNFPVFSLPCEDAPAYYGINGYFGKEDTQFRDGSVDNIY